MPGGRDLVVGPYVLLERLAQGGTGQVFKARHVHMKRVVALKLLHQELLADPEALARFRREIEVISQLTHPNVVRAYDAGPIGAGFFLVTELIEGVDLQELVAKRGPLPLAVVGWLIAAFHQLLVAGVIPEEIRPCTQGVPCSQTVIEWFGFVTIPLLSVAAFSIVIALLVAVHLRSSK